MKILILALLVIGGCDMINPPNTFSSRERQDRFADFNDVLTVTTGISGGNHAVTWCDNIKFKFEPTRVGAYYIEAGTFNVKLISSNSEPISNPVVYGIPETATQIFVYFSDGKSFEKTIVEVNK